MPSPAPDVSVDVAVIGGGVIGLAVARELALAGREVALVERERSTGQHTSSRNSEVVHAGFYYGAGSLKARLCVEGRRALYAYAREKEIPIRRIGKLVVAVEEAEIPALEGWFRRGRDCGVEGLRLIDSGEAHALEPEVRCARAMLSEETGIVDSHAFMRALRIDAETAGATVSLSAGALSGRVGDGYLDVDIGGEHTFTLRCRALVNAAGLWAPEVARALDGFPAARVPQAFYARGHYFHLSGMAPFRRLVYPLPVAGGLGVHVTLDLAGRARFGPDVEWVPGVDYRFDPSRQPAFEAAIRRWWPGLPDGALQPGYVGVRPRLAPAGAPAEDFRIDGPLQHGVPGVVHLFGIESPGLTAALAIARHVRELLS